MKNFYAMFVRRAQNALDIEDLNRLLLSSAGTGNLEGVRSAINGGANINIKDTLYGYGQNALHRAAAIGNKEVLDLLIKSGIEIFATDIEGRTALHYSVLNGHYEASKVLIECVKIKDKEGRTPLHYAVNVINLDLLKLLVDKGADVCAKDNNGFTALHYSAGEGFEDVAEFLIEQKPEIIHMTDKKGRTALHHASRFGRLDCIKFLLQLGIDAHAVDNNNQSALEIATVSRQNEAAKIIEDFPEPPYDSLKVPVSKVRGGVGAGVGAGNMEIAPLHTEVGGVILDNAANIAQPNRGEVVPATNNWSGSSCLRPFSRGCFERH